MKVEKQQLQPDKKQWTASNLGRVCQGSILSLCLLNFYAEYIMRKVRLDEAQAKIKNDGRSITNLRYADDTTLMAEVKRN